MSNQKHWVFTSYADEVSFFSLDCVDYCIFGNEKCPETGRWHKQGYVCFKKKYRLTALKKLCSVTHWEPKRGSVEQAIQYCMKDGDFYEYGVKPMEERSNKCHFVMATDLCRKRKLSDIDTSECYPTYIRYKKTFDAMIPMDKEPLSEPRGVWVYGAPGIGKDSAVIEKYKPYVKSHNKWWDGYNGEDTILFSDFDKHCCVWAASLLKIWTDRYEFRGEVKNGFVSVHPKQFFVTSNYCIDNLFDGVLLDALKRRFKQVNCDTGVVIERPKCMINVLIKDLI
ncbi:replication associated protein [Chifec virus UA13_101]|nr:replication associated protein [Chifec virus UA13_101]